MELTRLTPGTDLFGSLFADFPTFGATPSMRASRLFEADLVEHTDEMVLTAELPGVEPDNVDVTLEGNVLTISGEKVDHRAEQEDEGRYHLFERRWGRFSRSFVLPRSVDRDKVNASFENGVLKVRVGKTEAARTRRIEIEQGGRKGLLKR